MAEEVDAESEYKDWIREVPERARTLALAARPAASRMDTWEWSRLAAAVLALAVIGLGIWVAELRREVDRLSAPIFDISAHEVGLGETTRGRTILEIPPGVGHVLLTLTVDAAIPPQEGRFEILDSKGRVVGRSGPMRLAQDYDFRLFLLRSDLPDGEYRVRIVPASGGRFLAESRLWVETARK